jgi:hypothetical protein
MYRYRSLMFHNVVWVVEDGGRVDDLGGRHDHQSAEISRILLGKVKLKGPGPQRIASRPSGGGGPYGGGGRPAVGLRARAQGAP